ncbi:hypothetical protein [Planktothricoides raciborskii]|uniref:Uncharacterized protein n=1 Tax=Planktothricoides raciborskii FACHB-1370 TaxID=2949576 RepID=A0ABR8EDP8_9CYAN|nr:hypothetical protein [Planktothricoides raciborskii]KOR38175.1 hypothetical protein AM228_03260 [Planktothricoides sp. SR001]MBD2544452.1 hypothetical protein [Planktothricoides raciborskii FACHB-1370]MBD2585715.1 hypothetical protein [Planktothricoides raciborskii FACHB-1261]
MAIRPYLVGGKGSLKKPGFWVRWQRLTRETRFLGSLVSWVFPWGVGAKHSGDNLWNKQKTFNPNASP